MKKLAQSIALTLLLTITVACAGPGLLSIITSPSEAHIFINGKRAGISSMQEGQPLMVKLPQGDYTLEATKTDSTSYYGKKSVFVAKDSNQTVTISLEKATSPILDYGHKSNGSVTLGELEWLRCSAGQVWNGNSCTGSALEYTFEQTQEIANKLNTTDVSGKNGWRVPTIRELHSLVNCSTGFESQNRDIKDGGKSIAAKCNGNSTSPTINTTEFPETSAHSYWSSSPALDDLKNVWYLSFGSGRVNNTASRDNSYARLRLVRFAGVKSLR